MYRILDEYGQTNKRIKTRAARNKPDTYIAKKPNQVWTWDITYLKTKVKARYLKLYMILDIYSRMIVSWEIHEKESGEYATKLLEKATMKEKINSRKDLLVLHSDNGAPMRCESMKAKMEELGVISSYSRPRVSNDNPYSESLFKTVKYRPIYPKNGFKTIEEAREWVYNFVIWYNTEHLHSGINYLTPKSMHEQKTKPITTNRKKVYEKARETHPERFNKSKKRNFEPPEKVALNPTKEERKQIESKDLIFVEA